MINLDDVNAIKQLDAVNVLGSIEQLGGQCEQAWEEVPKIQFPDTYKNINNIVFSGMGGSALGAYVMKSLFFDKLNVPFEIVNDYHLPPYVNEKSLVILASYSGTTEETLSCGQEALAKNAQVTGLTVGGKLGEALKNNNKPFYVINPLHNPSNQPRLGTGYSVFGQIAIFNTLGLLNVSTDDAKITFETLNNGNKKFGVNIPLAENLAKQLAQKWFDKIPVIVTAEFLGNVGRIVRNQIHETAKCFADYHLLPELNHHLMEGLSNPNINKDYLKFLFFNSKLYSDKLSKRVKVTQEVIKKQGIEVYEFVPQANSKLAQVFECIQFGAYFNYYLAMLYGLDPSKIPWVDYFKAALAKS